MKRLLTLLASATLLMGINSATAQSFPGLDPSPADITYFRLERGAPPIAKILYSRPQLKGRSLATLTPHGQIWRTGANETTEITFYRDVKVDGQALSAGTYAFYTIPGDGQWDIIFNSKLNTWGHFQYDASKDVIKVKGAVRNNESEVEAFAIVFNAEDPTNKKGMMHLGWGNIIVDVPIDY